MVKNEDGRALRRVATTKKLVEAHADLLREGEFAPTASQITDKAGVSLRTLWTVFGDMDELLKETSRYWTEQDRARQTPVDPDLPLEDRVRLFCDERQRHLEFIAPAARAMVMRLHHSAVLRKRRKDSISDLSDFVEQTFARELADAADATALRDRIIVVTAWDTWSLYTTDLSYSPAATRRQFERSVRNEISAEVPTAFA